jgi:hypothetical protein
MLCHDTVIIVANIEPLNHMIPSYLMIKSMWKEITPVGEQEYLALHFTAFQTSLADFMNS